jgi:hypothetical protein
MAQTETLLTTITATGKDSYSETTPGVVTVTHDNDNYDGDYGWIWYGHAGSVTVVANEGYTITKCVFSQYSKTPVTVSSAPFKVNFVETHPFPGHPEYVYYLCEGADPYESVDGFSSIEVYGYAPAPAPVNITPNEGAVAGEYWSTFYNATQAFTTDASTTIYKGKLNGSSLTLTEVTDIAAGQAVILKSTTGAITLTPVATTTSDFSGNDLKGGTTVTDGYDAYTLSRGSDSNGAVGFYKFSGSLDGSKAHLEIPTSAGSRGFIGFGDDNTTGIELPALADDEAAEWYSLDGRRLSGKPARKGIYVKDGQKYIIK